jgi:phospholipase/lecithinase/hemolysin
LKWFIIAPELNSSLVLLFIFKRNGMKISLKKFNVRLGLALAAAMLVAGCSDSPSYFKYSQVVVFGASLSDTGNVFAATGGKTPGPEPYYYQGRWSNGPLWIENVAAELGKTVTRSFIGGTNFAYGGAKTCGIAGVESGVPDMCTQVGFYLGFTGGKADSEALYVIDAASVGNNMLAVLGSKGAIPNSAVTATAPADTADMMQKLYNAGARRFLVTNVPDVGATPYVKSLGADASAGATALSKGFNAGLTSAMNGFKAANGAAKVAIADFNGTSAAGLANTTESCLNTTTFAICSKPDTYQFWDPFHPTAETGRRLTKTALNAIAE